MDTHPTFTLLLLPDFQLVLPISGPTDKRARDPCMQPTKASASRQMEAMERDLKGQVECVPHPSSWSKQDSPEVSVESVV